MFSEFPRNPPVANLTALTALNVRAWVGLVDTMLKSLKNSRSVDCHPQSPSPGFPDSPTGSTQGMQNTLADLSFRALNRDEQ